MILLWVVKQTKRLLLASHAIFNLFTFSLPLNFIFKCLSLSFALKHQKEAQDEITFTTQKSTYAPEVSCLWQALGLEQSPP